MIQKVAICGKNGELEVSKAALDELCQMADLDFEFMPDGVEKLREMLKQASFCMEQGDDRNALHYCTAVLWTALHGKMQAVTQEEAMEQARQAYHAICSLTGSPDEYVWESSSQVAEDCRCYFEE